MSRTDTSVVVVGGGIVGMAVARELAGSGNRVRVVEKETAVAAHQTGRNSGVIHSGLYYKPGSLKARLCVAGADSMKRFAADHGIAYDVPGKLVVATDDRQVGALRELQRRGDANGVPSTWLGPAEARAVEPHVRCVAALHVHSTGRVDYAAVTRTLADLVASQGGEVLLGRQVTWIDETSSGVVVGTDHGDLHADLLVNCAGLHSDRVARLGGLDPGVRIVPFRGEYHELDEAHADLVQGLVYPVPDPDLPFLGVHLTRGLDGTVHAGPNAVLAAAREGYGWTTVSGRDLLETVTWSGFRPLARTYWRTGAAEVARSVSRRRFAAALRRLVPELPTEALRPAPAGVRAQAIDRSGRLVDDFHFARSARQFHVLNAPSPAATASLEIARHVAAELGA
ncbi:L-2-hydroxyglutarate oxidase [Nocardioides KLBMP 9356]|uniref:L-2-hydroxyglutarate oxidase n=1 Tax=Nocardioides potassii TaxID=2911371 RepID=A0ABS9HAS9_9ACTN|nr:L-2-hydroxyglutarate oxidase [Nocardioides potassii]MCF6378295.1 L-2-hydroxyglutarate oxidase [Nocardioides potassii]